MMDTLLKTVDLKKYFKTPSGMLHAVDNVNIEIKRGTTLGVVGESGCGKSTLGRTILNLLPATSGQIFFEGEDITHASKKKLMDLRKEMQIIFQDPYASLDPRMSIRDIISEPLIAYKEAKGADLYNRVSELMDTVGLARRMEYYFPHELDGGRRQRIGVARALALNPKFIVCDEPVSALDVSIQAQILNLLMDLQEERKLTYMFITHDLSVVKHISDEIAVMYLGECVEKAPKEELFKNPKHPYTKALLSAILEADLKTSLAEKTIIEGEVTSPINPKPGCRFASRCKYCTEACTATSVALEEISPDHFVACARKDLF
ncbi:MAG: ATP-binding cassette domain-containing protein [Clostridiales bacterium]|nr:ATP-binding cassette domain-containing protein [Clostridiales bacterium]